MREEHSRAHARPPQALTTSCTEEHGRPFPTPPGDTATVKSQHKRNNAKGKHRSLKRWREGPCLQAEIWKERAEGCPAPHQVETEGLAALRGGRGVCEGLHMRLEH